LAALALSPRVTIDVSQLVDVVWADGDLPNDPRETIRTYVSRLRSSLGDAALVGGRAGGYALDVDPSVVDAVRFEDALQRCANGHGPHGRERVTLLADGLALWRGPAL
jgi:DNA-binding SARP family transcriptional activator